MEPIDVKTYKIPFNDFLGIVLRRLHRDGVTLECEVRDNLRNGQGGLHGGVTATLVDTAVGIGILHVFDGKRACTTVEMKLNYFLPLVNGKVTARSKLLRVGSSLAIGSVEIKDARKRLAAFGMATYKLLI
jgi:uncharacterized protein (TIGR00369 family)